MYSRKNPNFKRCPYAAALDAPFVLSANGAVEAEAREPDQSHLSLEVSLEVLDIHFAYSFDPNNNRTYEAYGIRHK